MEPARRGRHAFRTMRLLLWPALASVLLAACATSPLGRSQLRLFPDEQLEQMGTAAFENIDAETPRTDDARLTKYVTCVANNILMAVPGGSPQNWEVAVFESGDENAFALPGRKIGVYSGMMQVAETQDQLAAVIGHEVAHVIAEHGNERVSTSFAADTGVQLAAVLATGSTSGDSQTLMSLARIGYAGGRAASVQPDTGGGGGFARARLHGRGRIQTRGKHKPVAQHAGCRRGRRTAGDTFDASRHGLQDRGSAGATAIGKKRLRASDRCRAAPGLPAMNDIVLSADDALLRSTDEQVGVLLMYYGDVFKLEQPQLDPEFVKRRRLSLEELREALRTELAARDILPKEQDSDVSAWQFFVDRVRGLLHDEPLAVPLEEERKLLELCDKLMACGLPDHALVREGRSATLEAMRSLQSRQ